jgi:hypothetical protein
MHATALGSDQVSGDSRVNTVDLTRIAPSRHRFPLCQVHPGGVISWFWEPTVPSALSCHREKAERLTLRAHVLNLMDRRREPFIEKPGRTPILGVISPAHRPSWLASAIAARCGG